MDESCFRRYLLREPSFRQKVIKDIKYVEDTYDFYPYTTEYKEYEKELEENELIEKLKKFLNEHLTIKDKVEFVKKLHENKLSVGAFEKYVCKLSLLNFNSLKKIKSKTKSKSKSKSKSKRKTK